MKALNSFALMDLFDGVDEAMITVTASVSLGVEASAVIIKVGVSGTITLEVTIDLFDAYPETSRGLVRPFELISLGTSPLKWFEFGIKMYLTLKVYIKIGIYAGWFSGLLLVGSDTFHLSITLLKYSLHDSFLHSYLFQVQLFSSD